MGNINLANAPYVQLQNWFNRKQSPLVVDQRDVPHERTVLNPFLQATAKEVAILVSLRFAKGLIGAAIGGVFNGTISGGDRVINVLTGLIFTGVLDIAQESYTSVYKCSFAQKIYYVISPYLFCGAMDIASSYLGSRNFNFLISLLVVEGFTITLCKLRNYYQR